MHKSFRCPRGHQWQVTVGGPTSNLLPCLACPVCGGACETVSSSGPFLPPPERPSDPPLGAWAALLGYELFEELGRGGMGVVYKARQVSLNRIVALKMLPPAPALDPDRLLRFRAEAEAVARLRHPNIIQIYEVGELEGRPYLALEYAEGGGLDRKVAGKPQPVREAAALVETLARAVHHAHQNGIIHRDLKPANVLLRRKSEIRSPKSETNPKDQKPKFETSNHPISDIGTSDLDFVSEFGLRISDLEPKVTDFGLAKRLDGEVAQTQSGRILGTPSYMAPEQAAGQSRAIGPAVDVYALGAILYELLTGRPPFLGPSALETLDLVRTQEPVPPRRSQPATPRDLETVCLQCLRKEPSKRYATALDLAEDLARFLACKPVRTRPVGPVGRFTRWCRRQPALAALSATVVLTGLVALVGATSLWQLAEYQRRRAEQNLREARQAVHQHFTHLSEVQLGGDPGLRPLRKRLLEDALAHFQGFREQHRGRPELRADVADAHFRVALITAQINSAEKARVDYQQARNLYEELLAETPDDRRLLERLATTASNLGVVQAATGELDAALTSHRQALALRERLATEPAPDAARAALVESHINLGNLHARQRRPAEALASYRQALAVQEALAADHPDRPEWRNLLAAVHSNLGVLHKEQLGQIDEALRCYERARTIRAELVRVHPSSAAFEHDLASTLNNLGVLHLDHTGKVEEARRCLQDALARRERLARAEPLLADYQHDLADTLNNLGIVRARIGDRAEALRCHQQALAIRAELARRHPTVTAFQRAWASSCHNLGILQGELGRSKEALEAHEQALAIRRKLAEKQPKDAALRGDVAASEHQVARLRAGPAR